MSELEWWSAFGFGAVSAGLVYAIMFSAVLSGFDRGLRDEVDALQARIHGLEYVRDVFMVAARAASKGRIVPPQGGSGMAPAKLMTPTDNPLSDTVSICS